MKIREGRLSDAHAIARLIITAMSEDCCAYFYGKDHTAEEFLGCITDLCRQKKTQYSYKNTIVAEDNGQVVGIAVSYDGAQLKHLRQAFLDTIRQRFDRDFCGIDDETQPGELYLDSFAVMPDYRKQGIGTQLLEATAQKAVRSGITAVGLLVDCENHSAKRLYLSRGFKAAGISTWGGHRMEHLQKNI